MASADPGKLLAEGDVDDTGRPEAGPGDDDTRMVLGDPPDHAGVAAMLVGAHRGQHLVGGAGRHERDELALVGDMERVETGVLEGDIATSIDADALRRPARRPVALVDTNAGFGGERHLDAVMVRSGLDRLPLADLDLLLIENVGNLVCPAEFDVGQDRRAMVYAITEGEEKPAKYPVMFHAVDAVVVNKIDLLPHLDFDLDAFDGHLRAVNPTAKVFEVSARTGDGLDAWIDRLRADAG